MATPATTHNSTTESSTADQAPWDEAAGQPAAALTEGDLVLLASLSSDLSRGVPNFLSNLTGLPYSAENPPDFLAVRTGEHLKSLVTGYATAGWTDHDGTTVTWFHTGRQPAAFSGVAITYGPATTPEQQIASRRIALRYLAEQVDRHSHSA